MRIIGLDVSRTFAENAYLEDGHIRLGGRVVLDHAALARFVAGLDKKDEVVLEATGNFLPEVWSADERTQALRRQVARRSQIVRQRTRIKNEVHSVLATHLIPRCTATDLFGKRGRAWLAEQPLPLDESMMHRSSSC